MFKERRGLSTFVVTMLLLALTLPAGVVIYAQTMGYLGGLSLEGSAGAMFVEEASMTTETITAYVRNVGKTTIELDVVYVDGSEMSFSCDSMVIGEGELVEVTVNAPNATTFTSGKTYEVKLFAKDNTRLGFMIKCQ